VDESTKNLLRAAEEAVARLAEACRKDGTLYPNDPRGVAQVSRTGKWLLHATAALRKAFDADCPGKSKEAS
jgi:hypothetical protein